MVGALLGIALGLFAIIAFRENDAVANYYQDLHDGKRKK